MADQVVAAFVGLFDVIDQDGANPAFSQAGTLFQERLLQSLAGTPIQVTRAYLQKPIPSFPRWKQLFVRARRVELSSGVPATILPMVNLGPLKTLTVSLALLPRLIAWGWRHRKTKRRAILMYNVSTPPGFVGVIAGAMTGAKTISIMADVQVPGSGLIPDTALRRLEFQMQAKTLPRLSGLVVLANRIGEDFAPRVPRMLLEGAVDDRPPLKRDATDRAPGTFVLMYAGGLSEMKGTPTLLAAFARLDGAHYRLWITGIGPSEPEVRLAAAADPRIVFWGFPGYDRLLTLYAQADVLVNPHTASLRSAAYVFPSKLLEYLATGRPVISTVSNPEVASEYGAVLYLTRDDSADALRAAIERVAAEPSAARDAKGAAGLSLVLREKTWAAQGRRLAAFIRDVCDGTAPPPARIFGDR